MHKIWQEEGQTKSPCHDQLWISRPASKCQLTQSTSNIKYIHRISNTFIQHQVHSKDSNKNDSCTLLLLSRDNCGSRSITKRGVWFVVETSCKYMCGKIQKLKYILIFFIFPNTENWNVLSNWPNSAIGFTSLANDYYMLSQT